MDCNEDGYIGRPPASYSPHTADAMVRHVGFRLTTKLVSLVCTVVALLIFGLLWCIGIPTKSDLK